MIWGSQDERRPNPTQGNQTPTPNGREGFRETGEGETGGSEGREKTQPDQWIREENWWSGLGWRLTDRGLRREEGEWGVWGGGI